MEWLFLASMFYLILISIMYFSKKKVISTDIKIYKAILIANIFGLFLDSYQLILSKSSANLTYLIFINKIFLIYVICWTSIFTLYILNIGKNEISKNNKQMIGTLLIIFILAVIFLPEVYKYTSNKTPYVTGPAVYCAYICVGILIVIMFISTIKKLIKVKNIKKIKFIPLICFSVLGTIGLIVQFLNPAILLTSPIETFITIMTYFFIENPDVKMIGELNIAKENAEKANRAKSDFLSSMSHEIRTPLNAIVGLSEDIKDRENCPEDMKEDLSDIVSASNTLLEIVGNIMDINKIESAKMEIIEIPYNFKEEISSLARVQRARIGDKQLELIIDIAEDIPYELIGDRGHVKQVVNNLLSNAIKYTEKGLVNLTVKCINQNDVCLLIISVKDTGRGIKAEDINKLFSKFERLGIERNTTTEGTGLGLAITKKLVEMMGGKINVESQFGRGSIFMVQLPQKIGTLSKPLSNLENDTKTSNKYSSKVDYSNKSILIVDDNKLNIKVARRSIEPLKFKKIDECYNGLECIEKIHGGFKYDVILLDIMMPKMSGETAIEKLKEIPGFITPVIALTADAVQGAEEKYKSMGFIDYVAKPFSKDQIQIKLDNIFLNEKVRDSIENDTINESRISEDFLTSQGIDVKAGLKEFKDLKTYKENLTDWLKVSDEKIMKIKQYKNAHDLINYCIEIGKLKIEAEHLGFNDLKDLSFKHEMSSKVGNSEYIDRTFYDLEQEFNRICSIIREYLQ